MKLHKDGLCNICHKPEDVSHLLLDCHRSKGHDRYKAKILLEHLKYNVELNIVNLLTHTRLMHHVWDFIQQLNRDI